MTDILQILSEKKTFLFDMDGTLVNTEPMHAKAASIVLERMGIEIKLEEFIHTFYGMSDHVVLKNLCPQMTAEEIVHAINLKNEILVDLFQTLPKNQKEKYLTPGVYQFLEKLNSQQKTCAVVSASEDIIVDETLKCFELDSYMKIQFGRNQTAQTKPHPDPYLEAIKRLLSHIDETLIFEDSPTGLKSAIATGASVIRITEFAHPNSEIELLRGQFFEHVNFHKFL